MKNSIFFAMHHEISAGGIVIRKNAKGIYFAAIERAAMKDRTLPKGHQEPRESLQQTAEREVLEETGFIARPIEYLGSFTYSVENEEKKIVIMRTVHWFLMLYESGKKINKNQEIKKVKWLPFDAGINFLSYQNDQRMVKKAAKMIKKIFAQRKKLHAHFN